MRSIAENAGVNGDVVIHIVKGSDSINYGYNATDTYGDIEMKVIDPAKVVWQHLKRQFRIINTSYNRSYDR